MGRQQPRHAGADHRHPEVGAGCDVGRLPARRSPVVAAVGELLLVERLGFTHAGAAHGELHDPQHVLVRRRRRGPAPAFAEPDERVEGELPRLGLLLVGQPALGQGEQHGVRAQVVAQQRQVAGGVCEGGQQRGDLGLGQDRPDLVVGLGDRLDRADERAGRPVVGEVLGELEVHGLPFRLRRRS